MNRGRLMENSAPFLGAFLAHSFPPRSSTIFWAMANQLFQREQMN